MNILIRYPSTRHNLNRLRDYIFTSHAQFGKISLLIDCSNGEIHIPQALEDLEVNIYAPKIHSVQYRHAELSISSPIVSFSLHLSDSGPSLEKRAIEVIQETLKILNQIKDSFHCKSAEDALFKLFRSITMELPLDLSAQPGWMGILDREGAEKLLEKALPGTYLLREGDEFTRHIEQALSTPHEVPRCYLFTLKEDQEKISDKVLIQRGKEWAIYNDDFELSDYFFHEFSATIVKAGGIRPLQLKKAA